MHVRSTIRPPIESNADVLVGARSEPESSGAKRIAGPDGSERFTKVLNDYWYQAPR